MSVNKVILVGRLGQNPEVRHTAGGQMVANFSLATSEAWTDKTGKKAEKTEWHRIVVWGKLAELCNQYLTKGRQVYLEGRLQTRQWQDQQGVTKYTTEINASTIQFLGGQAQAGAGAGAGAGYGASAGQGGFAGGSSGGPSMDDANGVFGNYQPEPSFTEEDVPF